MTNKNICILFSGHLRNILDHVDNLKSNLLNTLSECGYTYDIYLHTWNSNVTNDKVMNNDIFYMGKMEEMTKILNFFTEYNPGIYRNKDNIIHIN